MPCNIDLAFFKPRVSQGCRGSPRQNAHRTGRVAYESQIQAKWSDGGCEVLVWPATVSYSV